MEKVEVKKRGTLTGHRDAVYALQGIANSPVFFSGGGDGMVVQWDVRKTEGESVAQLADSVYAMCVVPEKNILVVGHNYNGIHVLDTQDRREMGSLKLTSSAIFDIQAIGDEWLIASGDGTLCAIAAASLTLKKRLSLSEKSARCIAVNPGSGEVAVGFSDHFIRVFRHEDWSVVKEFQAHTSSVFTIKYTPDGRHLISGSRDARLKQWSVEENYVLEKEVVAHLFAINDLAFSPDGKHFVTCSMDRSIKVWQTDDLTLLKVIDKSRHAGHGTSVNKVLWSSFQNQVVSASDDRTLSVWDVIF